MRLPTVMRALGSCWNAASEPSRGVTVNVSTLRVRSTTRPTWVVIGLATSCAITDDMT
jgi:hypothetical protein